MSPAPDYSFCCKTGSNATRIMIKDTRFSTVADYDTWLQDNPVDIVVKLATPITIQLPPCPIDVLEGQNNIWADTGDTTLQYIKLG